MKVDKQFKVKLSWEFTDMDDDVVTASGEVEETKVSAGDMVALQGILIGILSDRNKQSQAKLSE